MAAIAESKAGDVPTMVKGLLADGADTDAIAANVAKALAADGGALAFVTEGQVESLVEVATDKKNVAARLGALKVVKAAAEAAGAVVGPALIGAMPTFFAMYVSKPREHATPRAGRATKSGQKWPTAGSKPVKPRPALRQRPPAPRRRPQCIATCTRHCWRARASLSAASRPCSTRCLTLVHCA